MKTKFLPLFLFCLFIINCDNESTDDMSDNPEQGQDGLLIKSITENYDGETFTATFEYDGKNLKSITESDGYKYSYEYNANDLPVKAEHYDGSTLKEYITFEYNSEGTLKEYTIYFENEGSLSGTAVRNVITYQGNNILETSYRGDFDSQDEITSENEFYATLIGSQVAIDELNTTYEYDSKNGVYKNISGIEILSVFGSGENGYYFYGNTNNLLKMTFPDTFDDDAEEIDIYDYTYNTNDYPKSAILSFDYEGDGVIDETSTIQYTYQ